MKLAVVYAIALGVMASGPAAAATLRSHVEQAPSGHQKVWHATLDLRALPAETRPAAISAVVDAQPSGTGGEAPRITIALNGVVIARAWARRDGPTRIETAIEDRLLSTENHIAVAVTALAQHCAGSACDVGEASLDGPIRFTLAPATADPVSFAQHVTRFRRGVAIEIADPRDRTLGERAARALAPQAPRRAAGPAEIVVSRETPPGTSPALRFDTGPVAIRDREGRMLYDRARLDGLTLVHMTRRGETPVLWVRPGTLALPGAPFELDYGTIALFGPRGREIAFAPEQDRALAIIYSADARREARLGLYWRLAVAAVWLALTIGLVVVLRRMAPLEPKAA